jgi:hypothetical protein
LNFSTKLRLNLFCPRKTPLFPFCRFAPH